MYYKAGVKSTVLQNCIGKKKHTLPNKTTSKMLTNGTENFPNILTQPHLGKVCMVHESTASS